MVGTFGASALPKHTSLGIGEDEAADISPRPQRRSSSPPPFSDPATMGPPRNPSRSNEQLLPPQANRDDLPLTYKKVASQRGRPSGLPHQRSRCEELSTEPHSQDPHAQDQSRYGDYERSNAKYPQASARDADWRGQSSSGSGRHRSQPPMRRHSYERNEKDSERSRYRSSDDHRRSRSQSPVKDRHYEEDSRGASRLAGHHDYNAEGQRPSAEKYGDYRRAYYYIRHQRRPNDDDRQDDAPGGGSRHNAQHQASNSENSQELLPSARPRTRGPESNCRSPSPSPPSDRQHESRDDTRVARDVCNDSSYRDQGPKSHYRSRSQSPPRLPPRDNSNDEPRNIETPTSQIHLSGNADSRNERRSHASPPREAQFRPRSSDVRTTSIEATSGGTGGDGAKQQERTRQIRQDRTAWLTAPVNDAPAQSPMPPRRRSAAEPASHAQSVQVSPHAGHSPSAPHSQSAAQNVYAAIFRETASRPSEFRQAPLAPPHRRAAPTVLKRPPGSWRTAELPKTDSEEHSLMAYRKGLEMEKHCQEMSHGPIFAPARKPASVQQPAPVQAPVAVPRPSVPKPTNVPRSAPVPRPTPTPTPVPHVQVINTKAHPIQSHGPVPSNVEDQQREIPPSAQPDTVLDHRTEVERDKSQAGIDMREHHIIIDRRPDNSRITTSNEGDGEEETDDTQRASDVKRSEAIDEHGQSEVLNSVNSIRVPPKVTASVHPNSAAWNARPTETGSDRRPSSTPDPALSEHRSLGTERNVLSNDTILAPNSAQSVKPLAQPLGDYIPLSEAASPVRPNNREQKLNEHSETPKKDRSDERDSIPHTGTRYFSRSQMQSVQQRKGTAFEAEGRPRQSCDNEHSGDITEGITGQDSIVHGPSTAQQSSVAQPPLRRRTPTRAEVEEAWGIKPSNTSNDGDSNAPPTQLGPEYESNLTQAEKLLPCGVIPERFSTRESRILLLRRRVRVATPGQEELRLDLLHPETEDFLDGTFEGHFWEALDIATRRESTSANKRAGGRRKRRMKQERKRLRKLESHPQRMPPPHSSGSRW